MILLAGADLILPDRLSPHSSVLIDGDRIVAIEPRLIDAPRGAASVDLTGSLLLPGFIDVHVHGIEGHDVLDGAGAVAAVARRLPRYGVTAFCPTSIACDPSSLASLLGDIAAIPGSSASAAHVLPAHLESNFVNPEFAGAQPLACLRTPPTRPSLTGTAGSAADYSGEDILAVIAAHREAVGIVTIAPELDGGLDLAARLTAAGHCVSIGHSGASYEEACAAFEAGVRHATHLFNRMTPMSHRAPGAAGAILRSDRVRAELICDGFHVHPAMIALAVRAKGPGGIMAITDATAGAGLAAGSRTRLGGRPIVVTRQSAELDDGTLAGSILTMDAAFRTLVQRVGVSVVDAARMCATTPAAQLDLADRGRIAVGCVADLVVVDAAFRVSHTYLRGELWRNTNG